MMMRKGLLFALGLLTAGAAYGQDTGKITLTTNAPVGTVVKFLPNVVSATRPISIDWGNGVIVKETVNPQQAAWQRWVEGTVEGGTITISGDITEFSFQEAQLATAEVEGMSNLESLTLSKNEITSFSLSGITPLKSLDLGHNKIANSPCNNPTLSLENAAKTLKHLTVSYNEGLQCLKIDGLINLEYLTANDCPDLASIFICLPEESHPSLVNINLDNCNLGHFYPVSMPSLRVLNLANNNLITGEQDYDPFRMGDYPALTQLDVSGNSGIEEIDITSCTRLEQFRANDCNLSHLDLGQAKELLTLSVKNNNLRTLDLGNNTALKNIYIGGNTIKDFDASQFPMLTTLDISNTQISRVDLMKAYYLTDFYGNGSLIEWVDFGGQQANRMTKIDLRDCTSFTPESMTYTLHTLPQARRAYSANLLLEGSPYEHADFSWALDTDMNWILDVQEGDGTAKNTKLNVTVSGATLTGEKKTGHLDRLYPYFGLGLDYDLDIYQADGGTFLLAQWQPPYFQTIKSVTDEALKGVPMYAYVYPDEGQVFKSVTVNGKEIKSQWFMISEDADIKVNFAEIGAEPSVAFTVAPGQKMSFLLNTVDSNGTVEIDWGTGARTPYEGQNAYTSGSYQIGGTRIDGTAAGSTVTLYGDIAAVDASGFGDVAEDFGLWDNAITAVDLSEASSLKFLNLYWNPVADIDLSGCPDLEILNVSYTAMTSLDLSHTPGLLWLEAYSDGFESDAIMPLSTLDISNLPALMYLDVKNNKLTSIDLTHNYMLRWVNLNGNNLTSVDLSGCTGLIELNISRNALTSLDVTKLTSLVNLAADGNNLTSVDLSKNIALESLMLGNNAIKSLDTSSLKNLQTLYINGNGMTADELNDLYYLLPVRIDKDPDNTGGVGALSWNLAVIQGGDKVENDGRRADSSIAVDRQWTPSHNGSNGGSDYAYLDILPTSNGIFTVVDADGNVYTHGSKVPKYTQLEIKAVPAEGYELKCYSLNGEEPVYESSFAMPGIYTKLGVTFGRQNGLDIATSGAASVSAVRSTIVVKCEIPAEVEIYNTAGICVARDAIASGAGSYTVSAGIYIVKVTGPAGTSTVSVAVK